MFNTVSKRLIVLEYFFKALLGILLILYDSDENYLICISYIYLWIKLYFGPAVINAKFVLWQHIQVKVSLFVQNIKCFPQHLLVKSSVTVCPCGLTQHQVVPGHFPGQVIGQVDGVHVDVLMTVLAHRLNHLPSDLVARFLRTQKKKTKKKQMRTNLKTLKQIKNNILSILIFQWRGIKKKNNLITFLHTAMRMMIDMIMMATKARTAANTATWENRAATGKCTQTISQEEDEDESSTRSI